MLVLDEFIPGEITFEKSYTVKKEMLGDKDEFILTVAVDKTFVPSKVFPQNKDERELGCPDLLHLFSLRRPVALFDPDRGAGLSFLLPQEYLQVPAGLGLVFLRLLQLDVGFRDGLLDGILGCQVFRP